MHSDLFPPTPARGTFGWYLPNTAADLDSHVSAEFRSKRVRLYVLKVWGASIFLSLFLNPSIEGRAMHTRVIRFFLYPPSNT